MWKMNEPEPPIRWLGLVKLIDHYTRMHCGSDAYLQPTRIGVENWEGQTRSHIANTEVTDRMGYPDVLRTAYDAARDERENGLIWCGWGCTR